MLDIIQNVFATLEGVMLRHHMQDAGCSHRAAVPGPRPHLWGVGSVYRNYRESAVVVTAIWVERHMGSLIRISVQGTCASLRLSYLRGCKLIRTDPSEEGLSQGQPPSVGA